MKIGIERAEQKDSDNVAVLFDSYRVFYKQESNLELAKEFISERIKNSESVIFLAKSEDDVVVGFVQLYPTFSSVSAQKSWVLNDLYVDSSARKMGAGRALMDAAREYVLQAGGNGISLETAKTNIKAQALYESLGYKKATDYLNYYLSL